MASVTPSQDIVVGDTVQSLTITVTLTGNTPPNSNTLVTITCTPSAPAQCPSGVFVKGGQASATSVAFTPSAVGQNTAVHITATLNGTASGDFTVLPTVEDFSIQPSTVVGGSAPDPVAVITLGAALRPGTSRPLVLQCSSALVTCGSAILSGGQSEARIPLHTSQVQARNDVTITAIYFGGVQSLSRILTLLPACRIEVPVQRQFDSRWSGTQYDDIDSNIGRSGCLLADLSMAANHSRITTDPEQLNDLLESHQAFDEQGGIILDRAARALGSNLKFNAHRVNAGADLEAANQYLRETVCDAHHPVIVRVPGSRAGRSHYVMVTGMEGNQFTIVDPGHQERTTLNDPHYARQYETRGFVGDPPDDISGLDVSAGDNVEITLLDPYGNRTGFEAGAPDTTVEHIPNSSYFRDDIEDDVSNDADTGVTHQVQVFRPAEGRYEVSVTGLRLGLYTLVVSSFAQDGSEQPLTKKVGIAGLGSESQFEIRFSTTAGGTTDVNRVATFDSARTDINNALQLGLIGNQGTAQALSAKVNAAEDAAGRGDNRAAANILSAFKSLLAAQASKQVQPPAVQILQEDADSLLAQYPVE